MRGAPCRPGQLDVGVPRTASEDGENRLSGDRFRALHQIDDARRGLAKNAAQSLHREGIGRLERSLERARRLGLGLLGIFDEGFEAVASCRATVEPRPYAADGAEHFGEVKDIAAQVGDRRRERRAILVIGED